MISTHGHGVCKITSNEGSGAYKVTQLWWNPTTTAWDAAVGVGLVTADARDFLKRAYGRMGDTPIRFWTQEKKEGGYEVLIDAMPLPDIPDTGKDYAIVFDHSQAAGSKVKWVELQTFACP